MSDNSNTFLGVLTGTIIGAALGILYAPDKGINTRRRIAEESIKAKDDVVNKVSHITDNLSNAISNHTHTLEEQVESIVSNASHKAEDVITTLESKLAELKKKNRNLQKTS